jgi:hypothetical protein
MGGGSEGWARRRLDGPTAGRLAPPQNTRTPRAARGLLRVPHAACLCAALPLRLPAPRLLPPRTRLIAGCRRVTGASCAARLESSGTRDPGFFRPPLLRRARRSTHVSGMLRFLAGDEADSAARARNAFLTGPGRMLPTIRSLYLLLSLLLSPSHCATSRGLSCNPMVQRATRSLGVLRRSGGSFPRTSSHATAEPAATSSSPFAQELCSDDDPGTSEHCCQGLANVSSGKASPIGRMR